MSEIVLVSLFNGASIAQLALEKAGFNIVEVYTSEVDKYALLHENHHYPLNIQLGDVSKIDFSAIKSEIKLKHPNAIVILMGGSPCQNLSFVGNRKGMTTSCDIEITTTSQYHQLKKDGFEFQGQSYLFWEFMRAKDELSPDFYFLENVKMSSTNKEVFDVAIGQVGELFNSDLVSAQQRQRYYWFNWRTPVIKDREVELRDVLDYSLPFRELGNWVYSKWSGKIKLHKLRTIYDKKAFTLTTSKTHSSQYYLNEDRTMYRNFEVSEFEALQTFPIGWTKVNGIPMTQQYRMIGNSWTVEMIIELLKPLKNIIDSLESEVG